MSRNRFVVPVGLVSLAALYLTITFQGCSAPVRNNSGSGGTSSPGTGGSGQGQGGQGGGSGPGSGGSTGAGGDIILTGSGGSGGASGATGSGGASGSTGAGGAVVKMNCPAATSDPLPYTQGYTQDPAVRSAAMTLATSLTDTEKQQQMSGLPQSGTANYNVFRQEDNTAKGIKAFFFRDGPRGVNINANGDGKNDYSTSFPVAIARGAAFDDALEYHVGQAIGDETLASGNTMLLAPTTNILRHPAWGRSQETYGEDSFHMGRLGSAFVVGVQEYVAACAKHYAANNIENGRESANATMDEVTLREVYARHYEMMVREGGVSSIMAAYNQLNGTKSTQNAHLLKDLLRTDFGFKGFVLSDWWAMPNGNAVPYPGAATLQPSASQAVKAGMDMELPWRYNYSTLTSLVSANMLTSGDLTTATARILEQKMRFKVDKMSGQLGLRTPFTTYNTGTASIERNDQVNPAIGKSHLDLAQQAAEESMVLLKNANNTLPINRSTVRNIAVIGANVSYTVQSTKDQNGCSSNCPLDFTTNVRTGDLGSSRVFHDPAKAVGPFAGIQAAAGSGITVTRSNAATAAASADLVIVIAGLTPQDEGEEYTGAGDRTTGGITSTAHTVNLGLDPKGNNGVQNALIMSAASMGKPVVVVLEGGGVIDMPWINSVQAVVMAWYPGQVGGKALGRLLFGDVNFSGKLPITWSSNAAQWPPFANGNGTTAMDYHLGYRWFEKNGTVPQFAFGYGLSYTTYTYSNLQVPCATVAKDGTVNVTVDVANNGTAAGDEIVLLFVSYPGSTATARSAATYKELKGYRRVSLAAKGTTGDAKRITIPLRVKDLKRWDTATNSWKVDAGMVKVIVAPSSAAAACTGGMGVGCSLSDTFTVN